MRQRQRQSTRVATGLSPGPLADSSPGSSGAPSSGPSAAIPDKLYFKIGEVADLVGVQAHVLRYWEKEIPGVRPGKSPSKQRRYRRRDVELFREVRRLLYEDRFTLAGVRRRLGAGPVQVAAYVSTSLAPQALQALPAETQTEAVGRSDSQSFAEVADEPMAMAASGLAAVVVRPAIAPARLQRVRQRLLDLIALAEQV